MTSVVVPSYMKYFNTELNKRGYHPDDEGNGKMLGNAVLEAKRVNPNLEETYFVKSSSRKDRLAALVTYIGFMDYYYQIFFLLFGLPKCDRRFLLVDLKEARCIRAVELYKRNKLDY
jgi:hypothetical protein